MKKAFSSILGTQVISDQAEAMISLVTNVHMDPDSGGIIALQCGFKQVLAPIDIRSWGRKSIHVVDHDALTTPEHLLRLQSVDPEREELIYKRVVTEAGEMLGRVYDYIIDTKTMHLHQLVVKKKIFFFTVFEAIYNRKHIVEIQKDRIVVKSGLKTSRARVIVEPA